MRWTPGEDSSNVEDRRSEGGGRGFGGGRLKLGCGGFVILFVLSILFKRNLFTLLDTGPSASTSPGAGAPASGPGPADPREEEQKQFVTFVLNDTQRTWKKLFPEMGKTYEDSRLVLFRDGINSACGFAESATGPFYCPGDGKVYLDLGFYAELKERFGASGDFAQAYVIAHEIGHHVQDLLGIEAKVRRQMESRPDLQNDLSVRLELQADCLAGVWGHSTEERGILEKGDVEEGLNAAAAIGDDRLQRMSGRSVSPESFTHGSSKQRVEWFRKGLSEGNPNACDTFSARRL
jgi:predicted metalloprotease